ncbi:MAG: dephospho-CoA kinase [Candidatus Marinimicrobia bacterium]|jgi:dephospho-CoA kinase|nr:dephospho-CoA kinase [Candidatus Neomarinimicrobiota bacterium]MBT5748664.1 dephospho-CoA kinase [Candidatus Neomarinimicrobiota bacterium]MBT6866915.1 dephospho-CoA kinase [Candidatus Neomarinimicrobiota bacterium]MBT7043495.1 dephospho-CoA kinase [Candidatus Neomarinimicrobiota bacterium]MBT7514644.1 dephospho-CoA kinase [Candidatus Neomarinimicrobiota bacterium]|tara:strand:- start:2270 stop:2863 length:594 start_codon:yes stop_codon:yes gene_type:complete
MLKIGLTGGIGSGKSSVSDLFKEWGAHIFDADTEAKRILDTNTTAQSELIAEFGTDVLNANNQIDKAKLARIAFYDEDHQQRLNIIIHPYVFDVIDSTFDKVLASGKHEVFVVDAALIYESGAYTHMDYVLVVTSHLKIKTERVMTRGGLTLDQFLQRVNLQWPDEDKIHMADFVIHNNGTLDQLKVEAKKTYDRLL